MNGTEELVRLLRINTDFAHITGNDPYLAAQIRDAVDASLTAGVDPGKGPTRMPLTDWP